MKLAILSVLALAAAALATPVANADEELLKRAPPSKCAPSGAHVTGTPSCTFNPTTGVLSCTGYTIGGVGNTNADVTLDATWSATVTCTNKGGKLVEVKTTVSSPTASQHITPNTNGQLTVNPIQVSAPTTQQVLDAAKCPNPNWTKALRGTISLSTFDYSLVFEGAPGNCEPFVHITTLTT